MDKVNIYTSIKYVSNKSLFIEYLLDLEEKLLNVFGDDQIPNIHYRRNSNPDRTSITVNITPPEKDEIFFVLKCVESRKKNEEETESRRKLYLMY